MKKETIDKLFLLLSVTGLLFVASLFYTWNGVTLEELPQTYGEIPHWAVDQCDFTDSYIYVSAWAFIPGSEKFDNRIYIQSANSEKYLRVFNQVYRRNQETDAMKAKGDFDSSGIIAAKRFYSDEKFLNKKIVILSLGPDNKFYRRNYDCK